MGLVGTTAIMLLVHAAARLTLYHRWWKTHPVYWQATGPLGTMTGRATMPKRVDW